MAKLTIVADENIPLLNEYLETIADITRVAGRQISAADVKNADVLLVRSVTQVNEALLKDSAVRFVGTCTIGTDHIDQAYLQQRGIGFASAPGCNAEAVVDYVLSVLLSINSSLADWQGKTLGIIGLGEVGGRLYRRLSALGLSVKAYDPFKPEANASFSELLACDVISLHVPLTLQGEHATWHLLDEKALKQLKQGALLINTSRGKVVDNQALLQALQSQRIQAVLDVYEDEPAPALPLLNALTLATAHIAGYSLHGKVRGTLQVVQKLDAFFAIEREIPDLLSKYKGMLPVAKSDKAVDVVNKIYPVAVDSANFLKVYRQAQDDEQRAKAFDAYRKNYRTRYEFGFISLTQANEEQARQLAAIGFKIIEKTP